MKLVGNAIHANQKILIFNLFTYWKNCEFFKTISWKKFFKKFHDILQH